MAQIFRFLPRERMVRQRFYSTSTSCPLVGTLAASCRAGNLRETVFAFLLCWGLVDLDATLSLAGPTMWNNEEVHRLDLGDNSFPPKRAHGACANISFPPTRANGAQAALLRKYFLSSCRNTGCKLSRRELRRNSICFPPVVGTCGLGCRVAARWSYHVERRGYESS